ncbi:MAG TPA: hypothetical protein VJ970_00410, partial [Flavobacteriaceae bacterium]|nr:hypothetical protein [Flavobacteriaceae bacterium]
EPNNTISLLKNSNNGFLTIEDGKNYTAEIIVKDFKGNSQKLTIPITGKQLPIKVEKPQPKKTDYWVDKNIFNKFSLEDFTVAFPKQTFYNNFYLDLKTQNNAILIHEETVPINRNFTLTFDVSKYSVAERDKLYIAHYNSRNRPYYVKTVKKPTYFYTSTKKIGKYKLLVDDVPPKIILSNFKNKQWISNHKTIKVKISDFESGIRAYAGEINGEWVLFEYEPKNGLLTYNLSDKKFDEAAHKLKLAVTDNVGNTTTLHATFFRKP